MLVIFLQLLRYKYIHRKNKVHDFLHTKLSKYFICKKSCTLSNNLCMIKIYLTISMHFTHSKKKGAIMNLKSIIKKMLFPIYMTVIISTIGNGILINQTSMKHFNVVCYAEYPDIGPSDSGY